MQVLLTEQGASFKNLDKNHALYLLLKRSNEERNGCNHAISYCRDASYFSEQHFVLFVHSLTYEM